MAETPKLVSSMGRAELDRIFVRGYDLNEDLMGKISFAQMVYLMLVGRMPSAEEGRMIDTMLIVLVDHGMTTGAMAARMTYHSAPEALQGAVAAAILGAGSVHLGSSEYCAKMLNDALPPIRRAQGGELVEPHLSLAFGTNKRVCFINFPDEVGPALFIFLDTGGASISHSAKSMRERVVVREHDTSR